MLLVTVLCDSNESLTLITLRAPVAVVMCVGVTLMGHARNGVDDQSQV